MALATSACAPHAASPPAGTLAAKSEALHNACAASDWGYAHQLVHEARQDWSSVEPTAYQQGASPMLLGMVSGALPLADDAVDRHARRACVSNANGLALAAAVLDESDEARLRAWLRRVEMDGKYRDFDAAGRDLGRAEEAWARVRPTLVPHAADEVDAAMAACRGAADEQADVALRHASHAAMDVIDSAMRR
ncbi:MAG TPA: hypothetical protein VNY33_03560 [Gaiellaceae bacterium]|jgi:hypothetical protein|nr:hypothetical protein [Gaiellaceae bacterium]